MTDFDLVVAGGGPVGLATAIAARGAGLSVVVLEQNPELPEKACGEGLMPGAVVALDRLGVSLPDARRFVGIRFLDGATTASAAFVGATGRSVSRRSLMHALTGRAREVGVDLWQGRTVRDFRLDQGTARVQVAVRGGRTFECSGRLLVGADGLRSATRRRLGLELPPLHPPRFGMHAHFRVSPWSDWVEVYWHDRAEAYVTPLGTDCVGVAVLSHGRCPQLTEWPHLFPKLSERLGHLIPYERMRGAGPLEQRVSSVLAPGVALVGDAAGYLDALSGEGLSLGFGSALALVARFGSGELWRYPDDHARLTAVYQRVTHVLLACARRPGLRRFMVRQLSQNPQFFSALLAISANTALPRPTPLARGLRWVMAQSLPRPHTT